ncbi:bZIP transcription factor 27-like [Phoenix dactylifera]|uniref:BZIP transcription factor 27-like n=1 Tax=Phoenix dactylifera TaxID=42345 RepID=A0A8B8ZHC2_PHODC|nr:bZIP transcription factor 27-like [Phoenix dactylifera]
MEEVWKDISLSTIHEGTEANRTTTTSFEGIIVQDLLAKTFKEPSLASAPFGDLCPPPFSGLSLNSGHLVGYPHPNNPDSNSGASPAGFFAYCSKKRASEQQMEAGFGNGNGNGNGADRRKKRMIKNRESAARRWKWAYTQELKQAAAHLLDENRRLKYELSLAMETPPPTKRTLQRTSTAPF